MSSLGPSPKPYARMFCPQGTKSVSGRPPRLCHPPPPPSLGPSRPFGTDCMPPSASRQMSLWLSLIVSQPLSSPSLNRYLRSFLEKREASCHHRGHTPRVLPLRPRPSSSPCLACADLWDLEIPASARGLLGRGVFHSSLAPPHPHSDLCPANLEKGRMGQLALMLS